MCALCACRPPHRPANELAEPQTLEASSTHTPSSQGFLRYKVLRTHPAWPLPASRDLLMEELRASIAASAEELAAGAATPATCEVKVQHVRQVNQTQVCPRVLGLFLIRFLASCCTRQLQHRYAMSESAYFGSTTSIFYAVFL